MPGILKISDAAALALHTAVYLATSKGKRASVREIAKLLNASENHLAKVLQRLARAGLLGSARGPNGGYTLARPAEELSLLDIYEVIEGPLSTTHCLLKKPICRGRKRILGELLQVLTREFREYMSRTRLADVAGVYGEGDIHA